MSGLKGRQDKSTLVLLKDQDRDILQCGREAITYGLWTQDDGHVIWGDWNFQDILWI
jgi:hypothetical protein